MGLFDKLLNRSPQDAFAHLVLDHLKAHKPVIKYVYDKKEFAIVGTKGGEQVHSINLLNMFSVFQEKNPSDKKEYVKNLLSGLLSEEDLPKDYADARSRLFPKIMNRTTISYSEVSFKDLFPKDTPAFPYQILSNEMALVIVFDSEHSTVIIKEEDLRKWGIPFDQALKDAVEQFEGTKAEFTPFKNGVFVSEMIDSYDATRLLLLEQIRALKLPGFPIALVPNRDALILTGSENPAGIEEALGLAETASEAAYPITGQALILKGDHWEPWIPEPSSSLFNRFKLLSVKSMVGNYQDMKTQLEKSLEKKGKDIFVASYLAHQSDTGAVTTRCVWSKGVISILPKAEKIAFFIPTGSGKDGTHGEVDWEKGMEGLGDLMEPLQSYPPYYYVKDFPTQDQFQKMGVSFSKT